MSMGKGNIEYKIIEGEEIKQPCNQDNGRIDLPIY